jgi:hypothetical protein
MRSTVATSMVMRVQVIEHAASEWFVRPLGGPL